MTDLTIKVITSILTSIMTLSGLYYCIRFALPDLIPAVAKMDKQDWSD